MILLIKNVMFLFQSTLSRRERRGTSGGGKTAAIFQSTLSRRERPGDDDLLSELKEISIHALTKRATGEYTHKVSDGKISIHALTKRATRYCE